MYAVTGANGFLGSHIVKQLQKNKVVALTRENVDLTKELNPSLFQNVDTVFHCAGLTNPNALEYELHKNNIVATKNLLEALQNTGVRTFIFASTAEVYNKFQSLPIDEQGETGTLNSLNYYAYSKLIAENFVLAYCEEFRIKPIILRFTSLYGKGDKSNKLIPSLIKNIRNNKPIQIRGDGRQYREYLYVKDAAKAAIKLSKHEGIFNVGSHNPDSVYEIARKIALVTQKIPELTYTNEKQYSFYIDSSKARKLIGDYEKTTLEEGIKKVFEWQKSKL